MTDPNPTVAVVTGAGAGLGRELAIGLARRGVRVAGFGRRIDALRETAGLAGSLFVAVPLDVADAQAVRSGFDEVDRVLGPVTLLVNNAAVYPRLDFLDETPGSFMDTVAINLGGVVACSHEALHRMTAVGHGRILNVSTFADLSPIPASSAYAVSKGAARILSRALIADVCDRFPDIVINDWMPGALATGMGIPDGLDPAVAARWGVALALWNDRSLTGTIWERDTEQLPPRSLKQRLRDAVLRTAPQPRRLD